MKLHSHQGERLVFDTFDSLIISIFEPYFPVFRQALAFDGVAVVLRGHVAFSVFSVDAWLILGAVSKFEFVGGGAGGYAQKLVAKADAEDGFAG